VPKIKHNAKTNLTRPPVKPWNRGERIVYPLTAHSQPRLDQFGPSTAEPHHLSFAWISFHDAMWACKEWHYSKTMPSSKTNKIGVFEQGKFIGAVVFGRGATPAIGKPYSLEQTEICELCRVALDRHKTPVSQILREAMAMVKAANPGLRLIVSYAATEEGHHGGVYQAGNWIYVGCKNSYKYQVGDQLIHGRSMSERARRKGMTSPEYARSLGHKESFPRIRVTRHKYLMPLDRKMRRQIEGLAVEYPKADKAG
jgi:hypothetical protein